MSDESPKAVGKSISFRPFELYAAAVDFGLAQEPTMNVSEVTCLALREFFKARGVDVGSSSAEREVLSLIAAGIKEDPKLLEKILKLIPASLRGKLAA